MRTLPARLIARLSGRAFAHEETNGHHDTQSQQAKHQNVAKGLTQAQRTGQPGQALTCSQTSEHGTPVPFGRGSSRACSSWCTWLCCILRTWRSCRCRWRRVTLRNVAGLFADRFATAHAFGRLGVKTC